MLLYSLHFSNINFIKKNNEVNKTENKPPLLELTPPPISESKKRPSHICSPSFQLKDYKLLRKQNLGVVNFYTNLYYRDSENKNEF